MIDGTTILAVDDTPALLDLLVRILSHAGYHVRPADNGDLALAAVAADAPDLILLDVRMKGMDGLEVCRRLKAREETRHIPIILISAFADVSEWVEGLQQGAADFITKPFQAEELLCRVRTHLDLRRARLSLERQSEALRETNQELLREVARRQHMENDLRLSLEQAERSRQEVLRTLEERRQAEAAVRESEARCRDIFERSTVGQSMTGFDGKLLRVNRAFADMLGHSIEELQQTSLADITHPDNLAESWECVRSVLAGERASYRMEKRYRHRDGHWVFADTSVTLLRNVPGTQRCLLASIVDITERKRAQALVLDQRATLNAILESADGPIFSVDHGYRYTAFNSAHAGVMKALYGTDIHIGRSLADCQTDPEDWQASRKNLDRAFQGEAVVEAAFSGAEGRQRRHFEVAHYPVRTEAGEIIGVSVFARETTARRRAEEAVARMQSLLNETQRITKVGGWEYDLRTGQGTWTDEVYRIHGVTRDHDINSPVGSMAFYTPEDKPKIAEAFARAIENGAPYDLELQLVNAKGERLWVRTLGHAEQDNGKTVRVYGNIMDLTERKQAEAEREHLEAQLRGAQRMEAIGVLAGGISHDFNNLLSVILCSTEFAMARAREDDPIRDELLEVKKAGARAAELTRQLLAFSRKQVLRPVVLNLNRVAAGIEKMLHRILGEDIDYVQSLAPDLGMVFADPGQIEQVLMNLVVNARDAMPTGGKLTIETANVELDEDYAARHVAVKPGPYVHLAVTDTGCGMDEATKARVFEPFFTTKGIGKGTGLGLSTVYGIVKQSGGNIWVYSEPGHGTAFKIYLPRTRATSTTSSTLKAIVSDVGGTETILVVEDEEAIRGIASRILGAAGYTVLVAASASDALAVCHAHNAKIHLLLTDVVMPVMGGRELAEHVVALRPGIRVLYMSGYTDEALSHHGTLAQGAHFIPKPLGATMLTRKVRETLDSDDTDPLEEQEQPLGAAPEFFLKTPPGKPALRAVAPGILDSLRKATKAARYDEALDLIEAIRTTNPDLAMDLRRMVETFDYDGVLDFLGR